MRYSLLGLVLGSAGVWASDISHRALVDHVNTTQLCGIYDASNLDSYTLSNNLWGKLINGDPGPGYQCSHIVAQPDYLAISWVMYWAWTNVNPLVKGFTNVQQNRGIFTQLSKISSLPTTWQYNLTTTPGKYYNLAYNIAYDFFTAASPSASAPHTNEVMIWTSSQYLVPVTPRDPVTNKPLPVITGLQLAGFSWTLYGGSRNGMGVFTFVNEAGRYAQVQHFSADVMLFFNYLINRNLIKASDYLNIMQAGSETIKGGDTTLTTAYYKLVLNAGVNTGINTTLPSASSSSSTLPSSSSTSSSYKPSSSTSSSVKPSSSTTSSIKLSTSSTSKPSSTSTKHSSTTPKPSSTSTKRSSSSTKHSSTSAKHTSSSTKHSSTSTSTKRSSSTKRLSTSTKHSTTSSKRPTSTSKRPSSTSKRAAVATPKPSDIFLSWKTNSSSCTSDSASIRALSTQFTIARLTPQLCLQKCLAGNFTYAGLEYSSQCFCGNVVTKSKTSGIILPAQRCNMTCVGYAPGQTCGGKGALTLYTRVSAQV